MLLYGVALLVSIWSDELESKKNGLSYVRFETIRDVLSHPMRFGGNIPFYSYILSTILMTKHHYHDYGLVHASIYAWTQVILYAYIALGSRSAILNRLAIALACVQYLNDLSDVFSNTVAFGITTCCMILLSTVISCWLTDKRSFQFGWLGFGISSYLMLHLNLSDSSVLSVYMANYTVTMIIKNIGIVHYLRRYKALNPIRAYCENPDVIITPYYYQHKASEVVGVDTVINRIIDELLDLKLHGIYELVDICSANPDNTKKLFANVVYYALERSDVSVDTIIAYILFGISCSDVPYWQAEITPNWIARNHEKCLEFLSTVVEGASLLYWVLSSGREGLKEAIAPILIY